MIWKCVISQLPKYVVSDDRIAIDKGKRKSTLKFDDRKEYFYEHLGILDTKASALLRFDGIILAVLALLMRRDISTLFSDDPSLRCWITIEFVMIILSMFFCLLVVGLFWPFLGAAKPGKWPFGFKAAKGGTKNDEVDFLGKTLWLRERSYVVSWWLSLLSIGVLSYLLFGTKLGIGT